MQTWTRAEVLSYGDSNEGRTAMRIIWIIIFLMTVASPVLAADVGRSVDSRKSPEEQQKVLQNKFTSNYNETLDSIYKDPENRRYYLPQLRSYYPRTSFYTAFSDTIRDDMLKLSFTIRNAQEPEAVRLAQAQYNALVRKHFANLEVLMLAASLSKEDVRFGNPVFFGEAADEMYKGMIEREDGLTPGTAIKVLTFGEEDIVLKRYAKGKLIKSDLYEYRGQFLNVHQFKGGERGKITKLYFDISTPIVESTKRQEKAKKLTPRKF